MVIKPYHSFLNQVLVVYRLEKLPRQGFDFVLEAVCVMGTASLSPFATTAQAPRLSYRCNRFFHSSDVPTYRPRIGVKNNQQVCAVLRISQHTPAATEGLATDFACFIVTTPSQFFGQPLTPSPAADDYGGCARKVA